MGKTLFAAVVAAVLASIATTLVLQSLTGDESVRMEARVDAVDQRIDDQDRSIDVALRRVQRMQERLERDTQASRRAASQPAGGDGTEPGTSALPRDEEGRLTAPDGSHYVTRAELDDMVARYMGGQTNIGDFEPVEPKTLAQISEEMQLTAAQEATLEVALRDLEMEMITTLFGDRPIDEIKREVEAMQDDPELQAEFIQRIATRGIANLGKIATFEGRREKKIRDILGDEQADEFLEQPLIPLVAPELEDVFDGF